MPGLVQTVPLGLLDLLGMKTTGSNPVVFPDALQGIVDLSDLYLTTHEELVLSNTTTVTTTGFWGGTTPLAVPPGELWVVRSLTASPVAALAAATTYRFRACAISMYSTAPFVAGEPADGAATEQPMACVRDALVTAGGQLGLWCESVTVGTAGAFRLAAIVAKLRV